MLLMSAACLDKSVSVQQYQLKHSLQYSLLYSLQYTHLTDSLAYLHTRHPRYAPVHHLDDVLLVHWSIEAGPT